MAKSLSIRPSWMCLKLCQGKPLSATLLAEILYRANVTKFTNDGESVVVFSHQEWADITGLSVHQVRKGLGHLTDLDLVRCYNTRHPFRPVLRALHVQVADGLGLLYTCLTSGDYKYDADKLCVPKTPSLLELDVSIAHSCGGIDVGTGHMSASAQGTAPTYIYNKKEEEKVVAEKSPATFSADQSLAKDDVYRLRQIPTLSVFLSELHDHYMAYHQAEELRKAKTDFHALDAGKVWAACMKENWGEFASVVLLPKDYVLFKWMIKELGRDSVLKIIEQAIKGWANFADCVLTLEGCVYAPNKPTVGFIYYYRKHAMGLYIAPNLKSYSDWKIKGNE